MERQVGLVRGTRWPDGVKCGPHGARRARQGPGSSVDPQSRARRFVGLPSKPSRSRCKVAANNRSLYAGFVGLATKPDTKTRRDSGSAGSPGGVDRVVRGASRSFDPEDTRRGRGACVGGKQGPVDACPSRKGYSPSFPNCPYGVCISRGSLVISSHLLDYR